MNIRENPIERPVALFYIAKTDVSSVSVLADQAELVPVSGKSWKQIYLTPGKIAFTQKPGTSRAGTHYDVELTGSAPGEGDTTMADLSKIVGRQNYFRIEFRSGRAKLFGNTERLPMCEAGTSSQIVTQQNFRITQRVTQPLPWLV